MTAKQAILKDKEQKLYEAWSQLQASADLNNRLQEELKQRDGQVSVVFRVFLEKKLLISISL